AIVDQRCSGCHSGGLERAPEIDPEAAVPRELALMMVDQMAAGRMPPTGLARPELERLVGGLIDRLWTGEARAAARNNFLGEPFAPTYRWTTHQKLIGLAARTTERIGGWNAIQNAMTGDQLRLDPTTTSMVALEALAACRVSIAQDGDPKDAAERLRACLLAATPPSSLVL